MTDTILPPATTRIATAAATAEKVVEAIAKVEGPILTGVTIFVPEAAPITVPMEAILPLVLPDIERALNDISKGSYRDIFAVCSEFVNHINKAMPNSPVLSGLKAAATHAPSHPHAAHAAPPHMPPSQDPSTQGSG